MRDPLSWARFQQTHLLGLPVNRSHSWRTPVSRRLQGEAPRPCAPSPAGSHARPKAPAPCFLFIKQGTQLRRAG